MNTSHLLMMTAAIATALPTIAAPLPQKTLPQKATATKTRFNDLAQQCSSGVHPNTLQAIARVESKFNPFAIGVVKGYLKRQPTNHAEAVATAKSLHAQGKNFSMGLMQVNRYNLAAYGLNYETVFEPCKNINVGAKILKECFDRAGGNGQTALKKAFSCYYSGNFKFGFKSDFKGQPPYVTKIILAAMDNSPNQTIGFSGSLKVNNPKVNTTQQNGYVPSPNNKSDEYIPMPTQTVQTSKQPENEPTKQPENETTPVVATVKKNSPEWDIFKEF